MMAMNMRITADMIEPIGGEGDVVGWIEKMKLVAHLNSIKEL